MKKLRFDTKFLILLFGTGCIIILFKNNFANTGFWKASFVELLMLAVGIILTFYYVEKRNDVERRNKAIERLINGIDDIVRNDNLLLFGNDRTALMLQQTCANKIKYLKDRGIKGMEEDILFIEWEFTEIRNLYSEHMKSEVELKKQSMTFNRHKQNIIDKCDKIRIRLYM